MTNTDSQGDFVMIVVDALRYSEVANPEVREALAPCFDRLVREGELVRVVANAGTTQFVLPSLFAQSYPLDCGGYDSGIRHRPKSFVEVFRNAGYHTRLATSCDQYCMPHGLTRGFERVSGFFSFSSVLKRMVMRKLSIEVARWRNGLQSRESLISCVQSEYGALLEHMIELDGDRPNLPFGWRRSNAENAKTASRARKELVMLGDNPDVIIHKIETIPPFYFFLALGRTDLPGEWRIVQTLSFLIARSRKLFSVLGFAVPQYGSYQYPGRLVFDESEAELPSSKRVFSMVHVMDVHSYKLFRGLADAIEKLTLWPRLRRLRKAGLGGGRPAFFDLALMQMDRRVEKFISSLAYRRRDGDSVEHPGLTVAICGDHGQYLSGCGPRGLQDVPYRTYREHLETPLILWGAGVDAARKSGRPLSGTADTIVDSAGVSATLLELAGLSGDPDLSGIAAQEGGREVVISENAGRGSADLVRDDLYFNVRTKTHSMKAVVKDQTLSVEALFDLQADPNEVTDISMDPSARHIRQSLLDALHAERGGILKARSIAAAAD